VAIAARIATLKDAAQARERIYKSLLKRSWLLAPDPKPVRVIAVAAVPPKRSIARSRWRHAQLAAECVRADPRLA
jgi:hypothetical protein